MDSNSRDVEETRMYDFEEIRKTDGEIADAIRAEMDALPVTEDTGLSEFSYRADRV